MQHISNNGNRAFALYLGLVFVSDHRRLGTEHDSARPGKKVPVSEKIIMLGVKKF